jgi:predicted small secreted protein
MPTFRPIPLALLLASTLAAGCAVEEGYQPIGEDQQDQGGAVFNLNKDSNPSASIFFACEEIEGCDVIVNVAFFGPAPEGVDGVTAMKATLTRPDGFSRTDELVFGAENYITNDEMTGWFQGFAGVESGDYLVTVELDQVQEATVQATARLDKTILTDWDFHGLDCTESSAACGGETFCGQVETMEGIASICTSSCTFNEQCATGFCDGFCI